jgi:glycosyltransferase involved in cell wall biosynthesis
MAKARGADISHWAYDQASERAVSAAAAASARMLAVSAAMKADMIAAGFDGGRIHVHYTGVDHERFCPGDRAAARAWLAARLDRDIGDAPLIATVGALIPRKGQALVIAALRDLPGVHYAMAGAGEDEYDLRYDASDAGNGNRVHFLGPVANADLPMLYRAADAVVMPSVSEGLANAWVEAIACGTPVVISEAGGARELVTSDMAGRVIPRDRSAIAAAVRDVLAQPNDPHAVAGTLAGRFDWDRNGRELVGHWRAITSA